MNAKSGKAGKLESPTAPTAPTEADSADPGEVEQVKARQRETEAASASSTTVAGGAGASSAEPTGPLTWVGVEVVDDEGNPVPDTEYRIKLPDGSIQTGRTDAAGRAKIDGVTQGSVQIALPEIHGEEWFKA